MSKKTWVSLALAAAGASAGGLFAASRLVLRSGVIRDNDHDYNFDPARDDPRSFSPSGSSPFRIAAREGNIWWNSQDLVPLTIHSHDGLPLVGHLLLAKQPSDRLALVVHGHKCVSGEMGFICRMYHEMGFNVFAPDQRAHGKSGGRYIGMGYFERRDMIAWLQLLTARNPSWKIIMHGISMGASTVMMASAEPDLPAAVCCAVEDCGFCDARSSFLYHMQHHMPFLPLKELLLDLADVQCGAEGGYRFRQADALRAVAIGRVPMLFVHGTVDDVVPFWMLQRLYDAHPGPKECMVVEGARHGVSYFSDPDAYTDRVAAFADNWLPGV